MSGQRIHNDDRAAIIDGILDEHSKLCAENEKLRAVIEYIATRPLKEIRECDCPPKVWIAFSSWRHVRQYAEKTHANLKTDKSDET